MQVTGDGSGCHDNSNCNAAGDPMEQMNNKYAAGLSSGIKLPKNALIVFL